MAPDTFSFDGAAYDPDEFTKTVRRLFERMHPGWTDEDLINHPSIHAHFCNVVRETLQRPGLEDSDINACLMNPRKKGGNAYHKPRRNVRLDVELRAAGLKVDTATFGDTIVDLFHGLYRNVTTEEMLRRSEEGKKFVAAVRQKFRAPDLPERLICQTLTNQRKKSKLKKVGA